MCVIYIDSDRLNDVSKVWVPYQNPLTNTWMWYDEGSAVADYVNEFGFGWNPDHTLYMSWVQDFKDQIQLLIPPQLVAPGGALGLTAVCKETIAELPDTATVNYDDWQNNIGGDKGPNVDYSGKPL